ncbi:sensor histidine kinase [Streptomyces cyaneofuscatus]|uniref:histidine kinase n=1 Tax=Streptomyces cyaneofuscatus TaxID=66883 RepID=A0ABZ1ERG3_9ACTN|nr:sensor histidine kinase [Streptomyces cyaneofuscatus]WSB06661.1 sensor histidine kinase [Streptomyces cyaneofuscatus]WSD49804.1 sensor histidine kinase [Streptomyces cyaneofuscatus]WTA93219.1 sensor histidine kinase [Streptomyces cyaneofuscatus]
MAVCGVFLLRLRHPVAVGWFTVVGTGAYYLLSTVDGPLVLVPIAALYGLASSGRLRSAVTLGAVMIIGVGAGALAGTGDVNGTAVFMLAGWLIAVVALGAVWRGRVTYAEEEAVLRATEERLRIARELHDVVGHSMSLIHIQASAALRRLEKDPARAAEALTIIKVGSREGLRELRGALGVLRQVDEEAPTAPAAGLELLDELVASATLTDMTVTVERTGANGPLPPTIDLAAYRIIQESLTNAAKHSHARHVVVRLHRGEDHLRLSIEDDGRGARPGTSRAGGSGIAGMTERARALGGTLTAAPRSEGGFAVRAALPLGAGETTRERSTS